MSRFANVVSFFLCLVVIYLSYPFFKSEFTSHFLTSIDFQNCCKSYFNDFAITLYGFIATISFALTLSKKFKKSYFGELFSNFLNFHYFGTIIFSVIVFLYITIKSEINCIPLMVISYLSWLAFTIIYLSMKKKDNRYFTPSIFLELSLSSFLLLSLYLISIRFVLLEPFENKDDFNKFENYLKVYNLLDEDDKKSVVLNIPKEVLSASQEDYEPQEVRGNDNIINVYFDGIKYTLYKSNIKNLKSLY